MQINNWEVIMLSNVRMKREPIPLGHSDCLLSIIIIISIFFWMCGVKIFGQLNSALLLLITRLEIWLKGVDVMMTWWSMVLEVEWWRQMGRTKMIWMVVDGDMKRSCVWGLARISGEMNLLGALANSDLSGKQLWNVCLFSCDMEK